MSTPEFRTRPPFQSTTTTTTATTTSETKPKPKPATKPAAAPKARSTVATATAKKKDTESTETVTPGVVISTEPDAAIAKNLTEERDAEVEWKSGEALEKSKAAARQQANEAFRNTGKYTLSIGGSEVVIKAPHMTQSEVSRVASTLTALLGELEVVSNKHKADSTVEVTVKKPVE